MVFVLMRFNSHRVTHQVRLHLTIFTYQVEQNLVQP